MLDVKVLKGVILSCFILMGGTSLSLAEEAADIHPYLADKFILEVGGYFPERTVKISAGIDGSNDHYEIDFSEGFGISSTDETFSLDFSWRFGKKWKLAMQYFGSGGSEAAVLEEDFEFNDIVFEAGSNATAGTDFSMVRLFFARTYKASENQEFGYGAGLHWLELGAFVQGEILISDMENIFHRESVRIAAPLPNIGLWYTYSFSEKWAFRARYDYFSASLDPYDGSLQNASIGVDYAMFKNAGLGLSYNLFGLDVGIDDSLWHGSADVKYRGFFAFLSFYW